jgi:hypothetical protein
MTEIPDLRYATNHNNDIFTQIITAIGAIFAGITIGFTLTSYMIYPIKRIKDTNTQTDDSEFDSDSDSESEFNSEFDSESELSVFDSDEVNENRCHNCYHRDCVSIVSDSSSDDEDDYEKIDKLDETDFDEYEQKKRDYITFSNLFLNKLSKMETRELNQTDIENLRLKTVEQESPYGKIIMTYNSDTQSFWWYSVAEPHLSYIPYKILDTVARLFAITYDCKQICVNYKEEWEKERQLVLEDIKKKQIEAEENKTAMPVINLKNFPIHVSTLNHFTNICNLNDLCLSLKVSNE